MYKLEQIKPIQLDDLVRCGNKYDGGYVLSQRQIDKTNILLSFGINADWTFEYDFAKRNPLARIYAYDYSTPNALSKGFFDIKHGTVLKNAKHPFILFSKLYNRLRMFVWRKFHPFNSFFNPDKGHYFYEKFVGTENNKEYCSVDEIFKNHIHDFDWGGGRGVDKMDFLVKIDIEGGEYPILPLFKPYMHLANGFIIEFHWLAKYYKEYNEAISMLLDYFYVAHAHITNSGTYMIPGTSLPNTLELTFISKNLFTIPPLLTNRKYPLKNLDYPNIPYVPDVPLNFDEINENAKN
jgi:hypothetical protein